MKSSSFEKWVRIIEHLKQNSQGLNLSELSRLMGCPNSTIHHILNFFLPYDYINQDAETKKYSLGLKFLSISQGMIANMDIRKIASKHLHKLRQRFKRCNINLYILRNRRIVCIEKLEASEGPTLSYYVGFTAEPHASAGGKVLISELSPEKIEFIYPERKLLSATRNTITDRDKLMKVLAKIRNQGYAVDNEESIGGVRCVAAPIRAGEKIIASLSINGLSFYMTKEKINLEMKELIIRTAEEISKEMSW